MRMMLHIHDLYWTSMSISQLIQDNYIRADMPDPIQEPELFHLVNRYQRHTCRPHLCGGPAPSGMVCRKGFPFPISHITKPDATGLRYIYCRPNAASQWLSPYNPILLLAWRAHINVQYICGSGIYKYITKYVSKLPPSVLYRLDTAEGHLAGRVLGSLEATMNILGEYI